MALFAAAHLAWLMCNGLSSNSCLAQVEGSRKNIEEHYDAGNAMYKLFLDPSLTYSSGIHRPGQPACNLKSYQQPLHIPLYQTCICADPTMLK